MTLQAQCHLFGWRCGILAAIALAHYCVGLCQNSGVVIWVGVDVLDNLFDAVAGMFEFCVERFVVVMAMILQAL